MTVKRHIGLSICLRDLVGFGLWGFRQKRIGNLIVGRREQVQFGHAIVLLNEDDV